MTQTANPAALLTFVHITDTHISADPRYNLDGVSHTPLFGAKALVKRLNDLPFTPDFVLHTGDVAYDPDESAYEAAREIFGELRFPITYLNGNHDDKAALQRILLGREQPEACFNQEIEVNGVQIVCLDSKHPTLATRGHISDEQLTWLSSIAKADDPRPLVVAVHHNPLKVGIPWWDDFMSLENGDDLHAALLPLRSRLRGVFFGHVHQSTQIYRDGILYVSGLSSWYQISAQPGQIKTIDDKQARPGFNVVMITPAHTFIRAYTYIVEPDIGG